jgi:hypothetical protein
MVKGEGNKQSGIIFTKTSHTNDFHKSSTSVGTYTSAIETEVIVYCKVKKMNQHDVSDAS